MEFHENCGRCVRLTDGRKTAEREGDCYDHGVVFSVRPLKTTHDELFQVVVEETVEKWAGSLRIGVTTLKPNEVSKFRALTDFFGPVQEHFWIWSGKKLHLVNQETKLLDTDLHSLEVNDVVGIQVRSNGELHTYMCGKHIQMAATDLPIEKELYVVFDLYGRTKKVSYMSQERTLKDLCCRKVLTLVNQSSDIDTLLLPKTVLFYLKKNFAKSPSRRKRRRDNSVEECPNKKRRNEEE